MKAGMMVLRPDGAQFIEVPIYVGYMGVKCWNCGLHNTTFDVYPYSLETNCLSCSRDKHPIPDWVTTFVKERVR